MSQETKSIPLNMHEDIIERHFARDPSTGQRVDDHALESLKAATAHGRETAHKIVSAHKAILADQMAMPMAREKRARDMAQKQLENITKRIDSAVTLANAERLALLEKIAAPPKPKDYAEAILAQDTRAGLLRLPPKARLAAINEAIKSGDQLTVSCVLNAPYVASGLTKAEADLLRVSWQRLRFPKEVDRAARLDRALDDLTNAGSALVTFVNSLTNAERIAAAEASEKAAKLVASD